MPASPQHPSLIGGHDALALAALQTDLFERSMLYRIQVGTFVGFSNAGQPIGPIGPPGTGPIRGLAIRLQ
jgi:hypothetical protein